MSLEARLNLKDDESLRMVVRVSTFTLAIPILGVTLLLLAPLFMLVMMLRWGTIGNVLMGVSWFLAIFLGARSFVKWWNTLLAITEKRVIAVRQNGFFDRHVTEFQHSVIQQVSYRVKGLAATLYHFGDISIEPMSGDKPMEMRRIPHPARVQELISELQTGGDQDRGGFGEILQSVSRMDARRLGLLKAEVERTLRLAPEEDADA